MPTLEEIRHSTAHLLAAAVQQSFPDVKLGIGPVIEDGFYYDFDLTHTFTPEDFSKIEKIMQDLIKKDLLFAQQKVSKEEAQKMFHDQPYKKELIEEFSSEGKTLTIYKTGDFLDLCKGGHVKSTKEIGAFKLLKIAGAYWRGDSKNKQMQRIYATAFPTKKELEDYLHMLEEAKKRDHRLLGKQLDLFSFHDESPGTPFFHPRGAIIYLTLIQFLRDEYHKRGYQEVITPLLYDKSLWETSGHWEHFRENMFLLKMDDRDASLKPMNCPSHLLIYKNSLKSYKDLPLRYADFAPLHRNEVRGTLGGLLRVRKLSQDDAHIFVTPEQLEDEIIRVIDFVAYLYHDIFHFDYAVNLSTKPAKAMGDDALWKKAESALAIALKKKKLPYHIKEGEGAFYGPKIDFDVKDAIGRSWQLATIQLDFHMPQRFAATYEGPDGKKHAPLMIHRALLGSLERFIGVLIEHFTGKFPIWLAPVQVALITVADRHIPFAEKLHTTMEAQDIRVLVDARSESIAKKVRENQLQKTPYVITIGDKEAQTKNLAIRTRDNKVITLSQEEFLTRITHNIITKTLDDSL